jgi:tRNA(Ile)-lysidine synthase
MDFGAAVLRAGLDEQLPAAATGLVVGLSGGGDSACLLAALAAMRPLRDLPLRAVHVDHGLQSGAEGFRQACIEQCRRLEIPLSLIGVRVETGPGISIEAAARDARYRGFALELRTGECLLTAHHAGDQAETVLLQLLRGAGLKGLAAMPPIRPFAGGWHVRPLLEVARADLLAFGAAAGVVGVEDPMNLDLRFERSYLRAQLWPLIEARWPGAGGALARTARHLAEAQQLLDEAAARSVERLRDGEALSVSGLRALPRREQVNVLRHWLASRGGAAPPSARLGEGLRQMLSASSDHLPAIVWGAHALRRYRERLFVTAAAVPAIGAAREWPIAPGAEFILGAGLGRLRWVALRGGLDPARLPARLRVGRRQGGETMKIHPQAKTHSVQHLCQSIGVLPWMRDALPLLHAGEALVAVGDLWQDARWCVAAGEPGFGCEWLDAPIMV